MPGLPSVMLRLLRRALDLAVCAALLVPLAPFAGAPGVGEARAPRSQRAIVVTVDDLPFVPPTLDIALQERCTRKLVAAIRRSGAPAVGFVNEDKLLVEGRPDPRRIALLGIWLDAGLELGNHTFDHPSLHAVGAAAFEQSILRGERVLRPLLAARGLVPRFFRHPFLHTGRDLATRQRIDAFLAAHGYRVAPVTIDNSDWIFARAYHLARAGLDHGLAERLGAEYVTYMDRKLDYWERQSKTLLGREPPQVLLIHASELNADRYSALVAMMRRRGYRFIALDEALRDPSYAEPDSFVGPGGISWLHRWVLSRGLPPMAAEPRTPAWVMSQAGVESE
jgi:peptidoglycan/xylan/chitin deacetylase (PgdA/CDA1 family)